MDEASQKLVRAASELVDYIDREYVFDKMGDAGCGGLDPYRSEKFDNLIKAVREALKDLQG